ncbi:MAG: hypothetical protein EBU52_19965 [Cytophagia bacterium]|nr:hypothetical protein [Cytophagia bacterium]
MWWPGNYYMPLTPSNGNRCALTEAMKKAYHPLDERLKTSTNPTKIRVIGSFKNDTLSFITET